jgi:adenylate cyclase
MDAPVAADRFLFGRFRLDPLRGLFRRDGAEDLVPVSLGSRALAVLRCLIERRGDLVSKDEIMATVWPNTVVEEANLTMQISTLRRILDDSSKTGSCITTVSGRGYRFVLPVTRQDDAQTDELAVTVGATPTVRSRGRLWLWLAAGLAAAAIIAAVIALMVFDGRLGLTTPPPRLSLVVLPFENLGGDPKDASLADSITEDLTSDLSDIPGTRVAARASSDTFKGQSLDVRKVGKALGVRYVLEGNVRRIDDTLRVNVRLTSTETGVHLWSDRFNEDVADLNAGQEQIVVRLRDAVSIRLGEIENDRSLRERPNDPDALDLILRARSIERLPWSSQRNLEVKALFERALVLDPNSIYALSGVANSLANLAVAAHGWEHYDDMERAGALLAKARELAPASAFVLNDYVIWLRTVGRCPDVIELAERALRTDPNRMRVMTGVYNQLAICKMMTGHAEEALALQAEADRLNPLSPYKFLRYREMGIASLLLGRVPDAITFLERAVAMAPSHQWVRRWLAAAYGLAGRVDEAKRYLAEANEIWPYDTVRSYGVLQGLSPSSVFKAQMSGFQEGMRLAGLRDHADEDADFGVPADSILHSEVAGHTPISAPGATTIRTAELARVLNDRRPLVINAVRNSRVLSIPGSISLAFSGLGGSFTDEAQDRLRRKVLELAGGDLNRPIVAVGWNSESFAGRNLALRLVALSYTRVYWYRGGREAWEVAGLPETEVKPQDW